MNEQKLNYNINVCLMVLISLNVVFIKSKGIHGIAGFFL
jgi:hypothetical protein